MQNAQVNGMFLSGSLYHFFFIYFRNKDARLLYEHQSQI